MKLAAIRRAVADYMWSDGCGCCRGPHYAEHQAALAKLLRVPKYADGSGYDFPQYRTSAPPKTSRKSTRAPDPRHGAP